MRETTFEAKRMVTVDDLVESTTKVTPEAMVLEVQELLAGRGPFGSVVVVNERAPVGLVMSLHLDKTLSQRYGVALYYSKSVDQIMDSAPLIINADTMIEEAAAMSMCRDKHKLFDDIIVTEAEHVKGVVSVQRLLETLATLQHRRRIELSSAYEDLKTNKLKVEEMHQEILHAYEKLKEVDKIKTDFLSVVSHELRTPLSSVLGFADITLNSLQGSIFPMLPGGDARTKRVQQNIESNIDIIIQEANRLTNLINDLLDIAKLEAGKVEFKKEPVRIVDAIQRAAAATAALFAAKGLELRLELGSDAPKCLGDFERLIQVVVNLLSNAVKFTASGAIICRAMLVDGRARVSVIDPGCGIAPEDQQCVFEKFKQVGDTLTDKPVGTGLGLPICKQIVEQHGGAIGLNSEVGKGSEFWFTLPLLGGEETPAPDLSVHFELDRLGLALAQVSGRAERPAVAVLPGGLSDETLQALRAALERAGCSPILDEAPGRNAPTAAAILSSDLAPAYVKNSASAPALPAYSYLLSPLPMTNGKKRFTLDRLFFPPIRKSLLLAEIVSLLDKPGSGRALLIAGAARAWRESLAQLVKTLDCRIAAASEPHEILMELGDVHPDVVLTHSRYAAQHDLRSFLCKNSETRTSHFVLVG